MSSIITHKGKALDLFIGGLIKVRNGLADDFAVFGTGPRITAINPVHGLPGTCKVLGPLYDVHAKEYEVTGVFKLAWRSKDSEWRSDAIFWLRDFLAVDENLKELASRGPVMITLPDKVDSGEAGEYFSIHNWVSNRCLPNVDWTLGPKNGLRFTG